MLGGAPAARRMAESRACGATAQEVARLAAWAAARAVPGARPLAVARLAQPLASEAAAACGAEDAQAPGCRMATRRAARLALLQGRSPTVAGREAGRAVTHVARARGEKAAQLAAECAAAEALAAQLQVPAPSSPQGRTAKQELLRVGVRDDSAGAGALGLF